MEKFQLLKEEALKNYRMADHMLNVTYPLVHDTKLLLGVADNLFLALTHTLGSILHYEFNFKRVPSFEDNFDSKLRVFRQDCLHRYKIRKEYIDLMKEMKEIILLHKTSPVEFRRKDRFVICTDKYQIKAITVNQLKSYLLKTKEFMSIAEMITKKNESMYLKDRLKSV
ncbi:MAG: hypothetical protein ABIA37_00160 [Candidatus Woesearchaeota archaeon]